jgi:hypothetical protein
MKRSSRTKDKERIKEQNKDKQNLDTARTKDKN